MVPLCLQCILFPGVLGPNGPNEDRFRLNVTFTVATIYPGGGEIKPIGKRHFSFRKIFGRSKCVCCSLQNILKADDSDVKGQG